MATEIKPDLRDLHRSDRHLWALEQARLLRARRFEDLDLGHLIEEVEEIAMASRNAVRSHTRVIMEHLLKLQHAPARDPQNGWRHTIRIQRQQLEDERTPTLRRELAADLPRLYARVRRDTADTLRDFGEHAAADALPSDCPWTLDEIAGDWLPEEPPAG